MRITKSIRFTKAKLDSLKHTDKQQKFFDLTCEGLALFIYPEPSLTKSFYAHWSGKTTGPDGKQRSSGRYRYICRYNQKPIDVVKRLVNIKLPEWKKTNNTSSSIITTEKLVRDYLTNGAGGYRVKSKGTKIRYKAKTTDNYKQLLKSYVLVNTDNQKLKDRLLNPYKLAENNYYKKALHQIELKDLTKRDGITNLQLHLLLLIEHWLHYLLCLSGMVRS